jgi:RNA recognition motif-containing protein
MDTKYENVEDNESKEEERDDQVFEASSSGFDSSLGLPKPTRQQIRNILQPLPHSQLVDLLIPFIEKDPGAYGRLVDMSVSNETFRKVFVHGLPPLSLESDLRTLFEQYGQIESISVPMESAIPPRCKGYAFVVYSSVTEAQTALLEPRKWFGGKEICCKLSVPTNPSVEDHSSMMQNRRIFISGLRYDLPEKEFSDFFSRFGAIESVQLICEDGIGKGYGFITYVHPNSAREAIAKTDRKVFQGRPLTVAWCRKREDEENKMRRRRSSTNVFQEMHWPSSPRYSLQNAHMTAAGQAQGQWYGFPYLQADPFPDPFIYVPVPVVQSMQSIQAQHGYIHESEQSENRYQEL